MGNPTANLASGAAEELARLFARFIGAFESPSAIRPMPPVPTVSATPVSRTMMEEMAMVGVLTDENVDSTEKARGKAKYVARGDENMSFAEFQSAFAYLAFELGQGMGLTAKVPSFVKKYNIEA